MARTGRKYDQVKKNHKSLTAGEPWYRRLRRNRSTQAIKYDGTQITITEGLNPTAKTLAFAEVVGVEIDVGILTNVLTVETEGGNPIRLNGLSKRASEALHDAVQHDIKERILDLAATADSEPKRATETFTAFSQWPTTCTETSTKTRCRPRTSPRAWTMCRLCWTG